MVTNVLEKGTAPAVPIALTRGRVEPVHIWAVIGILWAVLILYAWGSWITGPNFKPIPLGVDDPPLYTKIAARTVEVAGVIVLLLSLYYGVFRPWRRSGKLTFDGMFCICCWTMWFQDPFLDYSNYWCLFNSYLINFGCWLPYVPGVQTPNTHLIAEGAIAWNSGYVWYMFVPVVGACKAATWAKKRWPNMGTFTLICFVFLALALADLICEVSFIRTRLYAYASIIKGWALFEGKFYQFPMYIPICWGAMWLELFLLRYYRDDKGLSFVERGIDRLKVSNRIKKPLQFLAILGFCHMAYLVSYNIPMQFLGTRGEASPVQYPSYMTLGICGPDTPYDCPAPGVPIARRDSPTNRICKPE